MGGSSIFFGGLKVQWHALSRRFTHVEIKVGLFVAFGVLLSPQLQQERRQFGKDTPVIADMARDGHPVTPELVASTSPYMREQIRRFGRFTLDMQDLPDPLNPQPLPFETAL